MSFKADKALLICNSTKKERLYTKGNAYFVMMAHLTFPWRKQALGRGKSIHAPKYQPAFWFFPIWDQKWIRKLDHSAPTAESFFFFFSFKWNPEQEIEIDCFYDEEHMAGSLWTWDTWIWIFIHCQQYLCCLHVGPQDSPQLYDSWIIICIILLERTFWSSGALFMISVIKTGSSSATLLTPAA